MVLHSVEQSARSGDHSGRGRQGRKHHQHGSSSNEPFTTDQSPEEGVDFLLRKLLSSQGGSIVLKGEVELQYKPRLDGQKSFNTGKLLADSMAHTMCRMQEFAAYNENTQVEQRQRLHAVYG